ncbi:hypothetical protein [Winogradskya humida]|uniref:hypothetical protein n=1 Tax=Winogradskya humida TaxID=113566 RepID=UPI001945053F|nr:hypothetical protein [Actinoplanes humidus]
MEPGPYGTDWSGESAAHTAPIDASAGSRRPAPHGVRQRVTVRRGVYAAMLTRMPSVA